MMLPSMLLFSPSIVLGFRLPRNYLLYRHRRTCRALYDVCQMWDNWFQQVDPSESILRIFQETPHDEDFPKWSKVAEKYEIYDWDVKADLKQNLNRNIIHRMSGSET